MKDLVIMERKCYLFIVIGETNGMSQTVFVAPFDVVASWLSKRREAKEQ